MRSRVLIGAVAALALLATACAGGSTGDSEGDNEVATTVIKVGTLKGQPHLFHPFFYEDFLPDGYEVEVVLLDSSPDIKNATVSGSVDFGVTGIPAALSGVVAGEDVRVIASAADGGTGIVGIPEIKSVADLAGRKVGFPQGASQEILLRLTLEAHGLSIDDLDLVNLPFSDMAGALASGQIDAFSSAEIGPSIAKQAGAVSIVDPYQTPVGKVNIGLISSQGFIDANPEIVQVLLEAHIATVEHMLANPDDWADRVVAEFGVDPEVVATAITNIWPRYTLEAAYINQTIALATEMNALGYLASVPTAEDVFVTSFIASASQ